MRISCRPLNFSCFEGFWKPICRSQPLQYPTGCLESRSIPYQTANSNLFDLVWKSKNVWSKLRQVPMQQNIQWKTWRHSLEIGTQSAKSCVSVHLIFEQQLLDLFAFARCQSILVWHIGSSFVWWFASLGLEKVPCFTSRNQNVISPLIFYLTKWAGKQKADATCERLLSVCEPCYEIHKVLNMFLTSTILISGPFPGSNRSRTRPHVAHTQSKVTQVPLILFKKMCNRLKMTPRKALLSCFHMLTHYSFHQQHSMLPTM